MKRCAIAAIWMAFLCACATLTSCTTLVQALDPPQVSLAGVELKEIGFFEQRFVLRLRLRNPNGVSLPITGMHYNVWLNDLDFAQGVSDLPVTVPAYGEAVTNVDVTSNLQALLNQFGSATKDRNELRYRLTGHVSVVSQSLRLPFEYSGRVALSNPP